jgi:hypothetical protein
VGAVDRAIHLHPIHHPSLLIITIINHTVLSRQQYQTAIPYSTCIVTMTTARVNFLGEEIEDAFDCIDDRNAPWYPRDRVIVHTACSSDCLQRAHRCLRDVPNVRKFRISGKRLPVDCLIPIIEGVSVTVTRIRFEYCILVGTERQWERLGQCVQTHLTALETLKFSYGLRIDAGCQDYFESFIRTCCTLPMLQRIKFYSERVLSTGILHTLCQSRNLLELRIIVDFQLSDKYIMELSSYLIETASPLKTLSVTLNSDPKDPAACGTAIANECSAKHNNSP